MSFPNPKKKKNYDISHKFIDLQIQSKQNKQKRKNDVFIFIKLLLNSKNNNNIYSICSSGSFHYQIIMYNWSKFWIIK